SAPRITCSNRSPSSRSATTRCAPGPSTAETRRPELRERSTPTWSAASSGSRWSTTTTSCPSAARPRRASAARCAWRAGSTWCATATSSTSAPRCKSALSFTAPPPRPDDAAFNPRGAFGPFAQARARSVPGREAGARGPRPAKAAQEDHAARVDPRRPRHGLAQGRRADRAPREGAGAVGLPAGMDRERRGPRGPDGGVARAFPRREQMTAGCTGGVRGRVLYLTLDTVGSSVNIFTPAVALELEAALAEGLAAGARAVVLQSAKPGSFVN